MIRELCFDLKERIGVSRDGLLIETHRVELRRKKRALEHYKTADDPTYEVPKISFLQLDSMAFEEIH